MKAEEERQAALALSGDERAGQVRRSAARGASLSPDEVKTKVGDSFLRPSHCSLSIIELSELFEAFLCSPPLSWE